MTELECIRPMEDGCRPDFMSTFAENASVRMARFSSSKLTPRTWRPSRRPRSPSSNHNVKELVTGANFHHARDATPPASCCPAGGVGGVYRGPDRDCQTLKELKIRYFFRPCGWAWEGVWGAANRPGSATTASLPARRQHKGRKRRFGANFAAPAKTFWRRLVRPATGPWDPAVGASAASFLRRPGICPF